MSILNPILRLVFDAILYPFHTLPLGVGLAVISAVVGVLMLTIFKHTSNQDALAAVKEKIFAGLFEIRLFNDDIRAIFRAMGDIFKYNFFYMGHAFKPMLWMMPVIVFVFAQMQFVYGYTGLEPGQTTIVQVKAMDAVQEGDSTTKPQIELSVPDGLTLETPGVWAGDLDEMAWRVRADEPGSYDMTVTMGGESWTKQVVVGDSFARRSPERLEGTFLNQLLYPAEAPLARSAAIQEIGVTYPETDVSIFGFELVWWGWFLILSLAAGFALRKPLGVTI